jgi:hypothetical protein
VVDGPRRVLLGPIGELGVQRRGGGAGVAQQALDVAQAQAVLEQMGRKAVAKGMDGNFFLILTDCVDLYILIIGRNMSSACAFVDIRRQHKGGLMS